MRVNMTKTRAKTVIRPLLATLVIILAICSGATAQSRVERLQRDKMHRWMDCDLDCQPDWRTWALHRSPDFTVKVSFRGQPISGVEVTLTSVDPLPDGSGKHATSSGTTEFDGVAQFYAVPPGRYIAHVNQGLLAQSQDVGVEAANSSTGELRLEWPVAPIATRSVRGWVSAWERTTPQNHSQRVALSDAQVQLFDLRSGELVDSTRTNEDGYYEFPGSGNGLYVVRVSEGLYPDMKGYDQAVEVASNSARELMPGLVVDHVCDLGLSVLDPRHDNQEPCVPTGAADPVPPTPVQPYIQNRTLPGAVVIVMQQQVVVLR
jgi:hypothetical protein